MAKQYVKVLAPSWFEGHALVVGRVYEFEESDGTADRWEEIGLAEPTTEAVFKAQQNLAREERAATRAKNAPPEEPAEAEEPKARMISREQAPK